MCRCTSVIYDVNVSFTVFYLAEITWDSSRMLSSVSLYPKLKNAIFLEYEFKSIKMYRTSGCSMISEENKAE